MTVKILEQDAKPLQRGGNTRKGERTRLQIIEGAIRVVGKSGVAAATHRAVAKEAGVSLSTTTYYFTSLDDLLTQAFSALVRELRTRLRAALDVYLDTVNRAQLSPATDRETREKLRDNLVKVVADYLTRDDPEWRALFSAEMRFFFEATHIPPLAAELTAYRKWVCDELKLLPQKLGSSTPELDAGILYDLLLLAEYDGVAAGPSRGRAEIEARFHRFFTWTLNLGV